MIKLRNFKVYYNMKNKNINSFFKIKDFCRINTCICKLKLKIY